MESNRTRTRMSKAQKRIVARNIRCLRTTAGLTQSELAEQAGLNAGSISNIERGKTSLESASVVAKVLKVKLDDISRTAIKGSKKLPRKTKGQSKRIKKTTMAGAISFVLGDSPFSADVNGVSFNIKGKSGTKVCVSVD